MKGQWIGEYQGDSTGTIVVNVDELENTFRGSLYLTPAGADSDKPPLMGIIDTGGKANPVSFTLTPTIVDVFSAEPLSPKDIQRLYPAAPTQISVHADITESRLELKLVSDRQEELEVSIDRGPRSTYSRIKCNPKSWEDFKEHVAKLGYQQKYYRGQRKPWALRTSFHRRGRYDLNRYQNLDIPLLNRHLTPYTNRPFDLQGPEGKGALLSLLQHHGYPTPLLDWTYSPFIASFFAFRDVDRRHINERQMVRIYIFDHVRWANDYKQYLKLSHNLLHLSKVEFMPIDNPRLIPQQSATTVTNIDDIETYIRVHEVERSYRYLEVIDIPESEKEKVMNDLYLMGITAGSLFPGMDGVCEEFAERLF